MIPWNGWPAEPREDHDPRLLFRVALAAVALGFMLFAIFGRTQ